MIGFGGKAAFPPAARLGAACLFICAALGAIVYYQESKKQTCQLFFTNGVVLKGVPEARTQKQQSIGLSNNTDNRNGMLFSWQDEDTRIFWMKNTTVPLTVAFINKDGLIFDMEDMKPETETYHYSLLPAKYALEMVTGDFQKNGVKIGDRIETFLCE